LSWQRGGRGSFAFGVTPAIHITDDEWLVQLTAKEQQKNKVD
jgi:hypothetical protein